MSDFFRAIRHLLPSGRAWNITPDKPLRRFFDGLSGVGADAKSYVDAVWLDIFPETTRGLDRWDQEFGLPTVGLSDTDRRSRLSAAWKALGGQDPEYIQTTLRDRGFDVYVHEWWAPASRPPVGVAGCVTPRSPLAVLRREYTRTVLLVECGEEFAACGEEFAACGNSLEPRGYPLVNKILRTTPDLLPLCGEEFAACGEEFAACGYYVDFRTDEQAYVVPNDVSKWPYFIYIGGRNYGDIARVDPSRRAEFEALCLRICPAQLWIGVLVEYV